MITDSRSEKSRAGKRQGKSRPAQKKVEVGKSAPIKVATGISSAQELKSGPVKPFVPALPSIPELSGPDRAVLMLVHPRLLLLYWKVSNPRGPAELRLDISANGIDFTEVHSEAIDFRSKNCYVRSRHVNAYARIRLGVWEGERFEEILTSNVIEIPREGAGDEPEAWSLLEDLRLAGQERREKNPARAGARKKIMSVGSPTRAFPPSPIRSFRPGVEFRSWEAKSSSKEVIPSLGSFMLVLHAHLPFIREPNREFFLEEQWLFEAITETYLPLLDSLKRLQKEEVPVAITMSITPTLMSMLRDPVLVNKYSLHLDRMCELASIEVERSKKDSDLAPVTEFYRDRLNRLRSLYHNEFHRDLVSAFSQLEEAGRLEIITCAGTHGFLPHMQIHPEAVRAQIMAGVEEHTRQLGRAPRGIWLPECAYFEGLDEVLAEAGLLFFFVDTHAIKNASSPPKLGPYAPIYTPAGLAAFGRDVESSVEVWSAKEGYPGDFAYRDFYRDIGFDLPDALIRSFCDPSGTRHMTGFKYYRITGKTDHKEPYKRVWAESALEAHANDFISKRVGQVKRLSKDLMRAPNIVSMYDAELFGHWWFEGPDFLEKILRKLPAAGLRAITPMTYLQEYPVNQVAEPSASSWGNQGYYEVWLCGENDWVYPFYHDAERRMIDLSTRMTKPTDRQRRLLKQAGRELLLAQSSDWPFILSNKTSAQYATQRIHEHLHRFDLLARQLEEGWTTDQGELAGIEALDNLFPELDDGLWKRT